MKSEFQRLIVRHITRESTNVLSFDMQHPNGLPLPAFSAGSHVDVELPNGMTRSYSLVNRQEETHRYVIAVNRDAASRGGSQFMHDHLLPESLLSVSFPRNHFPLDEEARNSTFVAGGIGITPLFCMIQQLSNLRRRWKLYYFARSRAAATFASQIEALTSEGVGEVRFVFDEGRPGSVLDLAQIVAEAAPETHFYCCGPTGMLRRFEQVTSGVATQYVHREYFSAETQNIPSVGFTVELARSRQTLTVPPGKSILGALLDAGVQVSHSCEQGVCGACETRVLDGIPDHRDLILTAEEKASHQIMMICCSRSLSPKLVLDI